MARDRSGTEAGPKEDRSGTKNKEGNQGKEGKDSPTLAAAPKESPAEPPAAAGNPVDPVQTSAVAIRKRFLELRTELWPHEVRFPAPAMTLRETAAGGPPLGSRPGRWWGWRVGWRKRTSLSRKRAERPQHVRRKATICPPDKHRMSGGQMRSVRRTMAGCPAVRPPDFRRKKL